ncbi:group III truncated hemoglobin [Reichenbachiella agariperforans]|uniref:group III truncated hemoglobin n=1 Tax=Reichenbachiella agariperforans TaxID=156994 RepID=UPI001C087CE8|nr:group III truncated hemoglobin [Reichenbachiella agariperforans]MBU2913159.1 group III truncated hemoglobin [Reichenbachiella agariperforans]
MSKQDISTRSDLELLVNTFYGKVRQHEMLGPIFNGVIHDWPEHLAKLADFWETNLFYVQKFKGNPMRAHLEVDEKYDHSISQDHFGHWLQLWFETLDALFEGEKAILAKERARNVAHITFMRLFQARQAKSPQ